MPQQPVMAGTLAEGLTEREQKITQLREHCQDALHFCFMGACEEERPLSCVLPASMAWWGVIPSACFSSLCGPAGHMARLLSGGGERRSTP